MEKCKQCGEEEPLDHDGLCFWCWYMMEGQVEELLDDSDFTDDEYKQLMCMGLA